MSRSTFYDLRLSSYAKRFVGFVGVFTIIRSPQKNRHYRPIVRAKDEVKIEFNVRLAP
jgi:hypothetical protein